MITKEQAKHPVLTDVIIDGVDPKDYPDFCDAFIVSCCIDGKEATEDEIEALDGSLWYDEIYQSLI